MRRFIFWMLGIALIAPMTTAFAQSQKEESVDVKVTQSELDKAKKDRASGEVKGTITYTQKEIDLVVTTGPEGRAWSYVVQGIINPTIIVPKGSTVKVLFVNTDNGMGHDIRFGKAAPPFKAQPGVENTVGSERVLPVTEKGHYNAQQFTLNADEPGDYYYYCSVGKHAQAGMWGKFVISEDAPKSEETKEEL